MKRVLLIHGGLIPHYRVPIYEYLSTYLGRHDIDFLVTSHGIQSDNPHPVAFAYKNMCLSAVSISRTVATEHIDGVIMFGNLRHLYIFPTYALVKGLLRRKMIWWGQGRDLADRDAPLKNLAYATEHALCDSIILYAEHLKVYVAQRFHKKVFVANNTLYCAHTRPHHAAREEVLERYGITTRRNIISIGRLQSRKRLDRLINAVRHMKRPDIGLILVGPDLDRVTDTIAEPNIYTLGPLYGEEKFDLLSAADVCCIPGAVGLSIVDAFQCGLPFVTEDGDESAEMMYLKNGENGFVVPNRDVEAMAMKLMLLLDDDGLRTRFSRAARQEIATNGHIDRLCEGFVAAIRHAFDCSSG